MKKIWFPVWYHFSITSVALPPLSRIAHWLTCFLLFAFPTIFHWGLYAAFCPLTRQLSHRYKWYFCPGTDEDAGQIYRYIYSSRAPELRISLGWTDKGFSSQLWPDPVELLWRKELEGEEKKVEEPKRKKSKQYFEFLPVAQILGGIDNDIIAFHIIIFWSVFGQFNFGFIPMVMRMFWRWLNTVKKSTKNCGKLEWNFNLPFLKKYSVNLQPCCKSLITWYQKVLYREKSSFGPLLARPRAFP